MSSSLRLRLLTWLLPPLITVAVVAGGGAYSFLQRRLTAAYDQDLGDIARAVASYVRYSDGRIHVDFTPQAESVLRADSQDQIFYAVLDSSGRFASGDHALPAPATELAPVPRFWDSTRIDTPVRAVVLDALADGYPVRVVAAETMRKRDAASRDAMLSAIVPAVLLLSAAVIGMILGVRRGLVPIAALRDELRSRPPTDLRPVDEQHVMSELRPLVGALNGMLARVELAQGQQKRFIADAAHQLRTPIAGLITQLDLAKEATADREEHLAKAREGAARLARLARQVLSLAAADPGSNPVIARQPCDLADIVRSHADEWVRMATTRGVELEFSLEPAPLHGNAVLIGELASNLVDNAARYGAATVSVETRREGASAILEIWDDGRGIPAAERTRVFERFLRLDAQSTEGSGLGLAIVREIVERHGGSVRIGDGREGRGTHVTVAFLAS